MTMEDLSTADSAAKSTKPLGMRKNGQCPYAKLASLLARLTVYGRQELACA